MKKHMGRKRKEVDTSTYTGRFARRLYMLREAAGLTVEELAEKTGVTDTAIYNWESNTKAPILNKIPLLAKALKVKIADLLPPK